MKVELKEAKVELEVRDGKSHLYINGHCVELPKVVGIKLIFGDDVRIEFPDPPSLAVTPPTPVKVKKRGCQSPASKRKLSASLKKYHAKQRRKKSAEEKVKVAKPAAIKPEPKPNKPSIKRAVPKHLNGSSGKHLNGASTHF